MIRRSLIALIVPVLLTVTATWASAADGDAQLISSGHITMAISQLQQRVASNPSDAQSLNLLARAYYSEEQWDDAIATNQRALKLDPTSSSFHNWMGKAYGEKAESVGKLGAANLARKTKSEFEKAVELNPVSVQARLDLAQYYIEAPPVIGGGIEKARQQAEATERFDVAASHLIYARIAEHQKNYDEAERQLKAAIATAKNPATYWIDAASFYAETGRVQDLEKAIATAVAVPGRPASVLYDAAGVLFHAGRNFPGALQYLRQYLADGHFDEDAPAFRAHYLLGEILEKMNHRAEAAAQYRAALSMASDFKKAQVALDRLQS